MAETTDTGLMTAAGIGAAANIGGGIASAVMAKREAKRNRRFQERMSNTQYQRAMADMRKAGLNPILAYKQGGAGTPSGSAAAMPNLSDVGTKSVTSALAAKRLHTELQNMRQTGLLLKAQTRSAEQNVNIATPAETAAGIADQAINNANTIIDSGTTGIFRGLERAQRTWDASMNSAKRAREMETSGQRNKRRHPKKRRK